MPEVAHVPPYLSTGPGSWGLNLSLFSLYRQLFPRYRLIFQIAILMNETWPSAKFQKLQCTLSTQGFELELIFAILALVFKDKEFFTLIG